jgi:hypothetical protein
MASWQDDATIVRNASLRELVRSRRRDQLGFLMEARRLVEEAPLRTHHAYGVVNSRASLGVTPGSSPYIAHLMAAFEACLPDYTLFEFELWFGSERPTPPHNDAVFYLKTGQTVALQFWLLIEACPMPAAAGALTDSPGGKNALQCLVPAVPGVMFPGMTGVLTRDGLVDYHAEQIVGGDDMSIGDCLLFKNSVIHTSAGSSDTFRAALAFRAHLAGEDYSSDMDTLLWFRDELRKNEALEQRLVTTENPYFQRVVHRLKSIPGGAPDLSRVCKVDRNDYPGLRRRLQEFDFSAAPHRAGEPAPALQDTAPRV